MDDKVDTPSNMPKGAHTETFHRLFESNDGDFTVHGLTKTWKLHKMFLRCCTFFHGACDGRFQEAVTGSIDLSREHEPSLEKLLNFLYWPHWEVPTSSSGEYQRDSISHARVYEIAKRFGVAQLARLAKVEFEDDFHVESDWQKIRPDLAEVVKVAVRRRHPLG